VSSEPTCIRIRADELRAIREAMRDLSSLITELEAGRGRQAGEWIVSG
jgi:hypothetical protein